MPIGSAPAIPWVVPSRTPPDASMASAIGIMISAVDVFEMNIEISRRRGHDGQQQLPVRSPGAVQDGQRQRWCRPVRSIASAMKPPPRNRNIVGE